MVRALIGEGKLDPIAMAHAAAESCTGLQAPAGDAVMTPEDALLWCAPFYACEPHWNASNAYILATLGTGESTMPESRVPLPVCPVTKSYGQATRSSQLSLAGPGYSQIKKHGDFLVDCLISEPVGDVLQHYS